MGLTIFSKCQNPVIVKNKVYPCGQCVLCRRRRMLEWTLRGTHELQTQEYKAVFLTLTYKPEYLPREGYNEIEIVRRSEEDAGGNLKPEDMTLFIKRLRKYIQTHLEDKKIKYIYCGEYGEKRYRPHYHIVIYGLKHNDISEEKYTELWGLGKCVLSDGEVTEKGIYYTVGYVSKKILNRYTKTKEYYQKGRLPPFLRVSKGIGQDWCIINKDSYTENLEITTSWGKAPVPRYYLKVLRKSEGFVAKYKSFIFDKATGKKQRISEYKLFINPNGNYTKKIYNCQLKRLLETFKKAEDELYAHEHYFELLGYYEENIKQFFKYEKQRLIQWRILKYWEHEKTFIRKAHDNYRVKELPRDLSEEVTDCHGIYRGILSDELRGNEGNEAVEKIRVIMNGAYGKRQRMEIMQELGNEAI